MLPPIPAELTSCLCILQDWSWIIYLDWVPNRLFCILRSKQSPCQCQVRYSKLLQQMMEWVGGIQHYVLFSSSQDITVSSNTMLSLFSHFLRNAKLTIQGSQESQKRKLSIFQGTSELWKLNLQILCWIGCQRSPQPINKHGF